jgi:hypothetical protein
MRSITLFGSTFTPNGETKFGVPEFTDGQTRVLINSNLEIMTRGGKLKPIAEAGYCDIVRYVYESRYNLTNHKLLD